jgi:hypothetical protein
LAEHGGKEVRGRLNGALVRQSPALLLLLGWLLAPVGLAAQDPIVPIQFSFSDPGARSMGFGGAFVALADDATAAISNPAGLVQLVKPEISVEGRRWSYSTPYTERGRIEGLPSGIGADTTVGLRTASSDDTLTGPSFLSVAYPKGKWSLAFFRHQLANFEFSSETHGIFGGGTSCCQIRFFDQRGATTLDFVSYGVAGAYRLSERLDVGFGATYHQSSLTSQAAVFRPDEDPVAGLLAPTSYLPERSWATQRVVGDDTSWGLIGGFLWRLSDNWRVGGVYRQGPEAAATVETRAGEAFAPGVPPGAVLLSVAPPPVEFPAVLGLGFAYRDPDGGLTVSFQWDRIEYSSIVESLGGEQALDDAYELHLGAEYVFLRSTPIVAVRVGAWLDPDHQVRDTSADPFIRELQPRGEDRVHYAVGLGVALKSFQIDLGIDLADTVDTVSLSTIYSF